MNDAVVIGSGIGGVLSALILQKRGIQTTILEKSPVAGGLLTSFMQNDYCFDWGTHIIGHTGHEGAHQILFGSLQSAEWNKFGNIKAGSYFNNTLSDYSPFLNLLSLDVTTLLQIQSELIGTIQDLNLECKDAGMLLAKKFGETALSVVFKPVLNKLINADPEDLSPSALKLFGLTRIIAFDKEKTADLKKEPYLDAKLGFHGNIIDPAKGFYYPKQGGIGLWIDLMLTKFKNLGGVVKVSQDITEFGVINRQIKSVRLGNGELLSSDCLVSSLPPGLMAKMLKTEVINEKATKIPKFQKTSLVNCVFSHPLLTDLQYLTVYDTDTNIFRVTFYQNLRSKNQGKYGCTFEVFTLSSESVSIDQATKFLAEAGLLDEKNKLIAYEIMTPVVSFPQLTPDLEEKTNSAREQLLSEFENLRFVGKSSGRGFFMNEVLRDVFEQMTKL